MDQHTLINKTDPDLQTHWHGMTSFSHAFDLDSNEMVELGVFNPTLNRDTALYIDPFLLSQSKAEEFSERAIDTYREFFTDILSFLETAKSENDAAWKTADNMLKLKEVPFTCLGMGSGTIYGTAWGHQFRSMVLNEGKRLVNMNIVSIVSDIGRRV